MGGPEVFVEVVSTPELKPAAGAAQRGAPPAPAAPRRCATARTASVAKTPRVTATCSAVALSARSTSTPTNTPGSPKARIVAESRASGCGRRPSVPSVIALTIRPSRISRPTACGGSVAANSRGAEGSEKPKPVADWSAAPASTPIPAAISRPLTALVSTSGPRAADVRPRRRPEVDRVREQQLAGRGGGRVVVGLALAAARDAALEEAVTTPGQ